MTFVITLPCCNDATCVPACPVDCIHPTPAEPGFGGSEMLYIDPAACIDCGACLDVCPVSAIAADTDLAPEDEVYLEVNAAYYAGLKTAPSTVEEPALSVPTAPLRVAIVGSGPAAMYAADALLTLRGADVQVDVFERLPVPYGLLRYGVAPDHPGTKEVAKLFRRTTTRKGFSFHLDVEVGTHITHQELMGCFHAVVYAVGASSDRALGIPGEDLPGSASATDFVAWYNGHPDALGLTFDLSQERAVVVGNGNVALDVARVLASDVDLLATTDIADHALEVLAESKVREVVVLGRRGIAQAAYTLPELLGLDRVAGLEVRAVLDEVQLDGASLAAGVDEIVRLKARVAAEIAGRPDRGLDRRVVLRHLHSPVEMLGSETVSGLRISRNELVEEGGLVRARATGHLEDLDCGLVLRSVGYRGRPLPDLPHDEVRGTLPQIAGRVVDPGTREPLTGVYATGWVKRGPSGVIGTNKWCAHDTVARLLEDHAAGRLPAPTGGQEALTALLADRRPGALGVHGWQLIDAHERTAGRAVQRPRVKLVERRAMLEVGGSERP